MPKNKLIIPGYTGAMGGEDLWIATNNDEYGIIKVKILDDKLRSHLYCQNVKITIEIITEDEMKELIH
jgi:hypothetical protein